MLPEEIWCVPPSPDVGGDHFSRLHMLSAPSPSDGDEDELTDFELLLEVEVPTHMRLLRCACVTSESASLHATAIMRGLATHVDGADVRPCRRGSPRHEMRPPSDEGGGYGQLQDG